jgi:flagellar L-ring protein precursor FlgH
MPSNQVRSALRALLLMGIFPAFIAASNAKVPFKAPAKSAAQLRTDYISRLQQQNVPAAELRTTGSLWSSQSALGDLSVDYKARHLNDTITIVVSVQTTAAQSGTVNSQRTFTASSAITGVAGNAFPATNPLIAGNSSSVLKGQGSTASNTAFSTSLTGQVIAVLPNGNLVVEASRAIFMNNQHENVVVRGMIRPGDIGPSNTVPSSALSNLEIEMKGKGIISDGVRPPNPITRAVLWLFGF